MSKMMGQQPRTDSLFYYFRLEDQIPDDHLLKRLDRFIDFGFVRERLRDTYSAIGRPSIDPEVLLRLLLVGYLYGITSERRLMEEVRMHLAYRWFSRLGFEREIPDHSTFSKNRHGRFRGVGVFLEVFEEIVRRCLEAGLVAGKRLTVDGTMVTADASPLRGTKPEQLGEVAKVSRTVREYLADLARENPVSENEEKPAPRSVAAHYVSTTDPDACWATKLGGRSVPSYLNHYLIDNASCIILGVEATQARFRQETLAARRMLVRVKERFGISAEGVGADKAYGSGEFLAWLLERSIQPYIPVIDRRHQTHRRFTRDQFLLETAVKNRPSPDQLLNVALTYLSPPHLIHPESGCPVATLGPELARSSKKVKQTLAAAIRTRLKNLSDLISSSVPLEKRKRLTAGAVACMVGGLVLARGLKEAEALELLKDCQAFLLDTLANSDV